MSATLGVGGSSPEAALASLSNMMEGVAPIAAAEYRARIARAQALMQTQSLSAIFIPAGTNLAYFTGTQWRPSERLVGALIPAHGELRYLAPYFEIGSLRDFSGLEAPIHAWHEHESPYRLAVESLAQMGISAGARVGLCESTPFFIYDGLRALATGVELVNAASVTAPCRMRKSPSELALIQRAHTMTLAVHRATASMLREGITTTEVTAFIDAAHRKVGATGSYFCIALFGAATSFPHGVKHPQVLVRGDMVLIDTGCLVEGYMSDITRSYVFGTPTERQRAVWNSEHAAQAAAFHAARLGATCESVDAAARSSLEADGFGPDYDLPGLPHRTGHGIGLDIHEWPYLVRGDRTILDIGMCFSNEPMICVPGELGVRHEDHFHMTATGPVWFTEPSPSIDDPFGLGS
jgi:Xaa-Pro dipeptidase